jgi:AcrR family transcriptional regulator
VETSAIARARYHWFVTFVDSTDAVGARAEVAARIVAVAADLLATGGREALTTRAVAAAAGVQAPTIYRLFHDKSGLLDAVAEHGFATYLAAKVTRQPGPDPVDDLRAGWHLHVGFGLANPAIYALMYGDPQPGVDPPAAAAAVRILEGHIRRLAVSGRLRVSETTASDLVQAAGRGTVLTLLAQPDDRRNQELSELALEAVIAAITFDAAVVAEPGAAAAAITLRAVLPDATILTANERLLLEEWLDRLAADRPT